tara:strand:+ start:994 stop:2256 length:1263 start_codon:yes stop_codon:yes gene_type:complete
VDQLQIGMYVAQLDRPWLETPFLFQGFYIRDEDEIQEIRQFCKQVHVTSESLPDDFEPVKKVDTEKEVAEAIDTNRVTLQAQFFRESGGRTNVEQTNVVYKDATTLKAEMSTASRVHTQVATAVEGVMKNLKRTGSLGIDQLESAVTPMVDSVLRNPAALACLVRMQKKDEYLYNHSLASAVWASILGRQIGLARDDLDVIALGALLLDVGKTLVPDSILTKPDSLSDKERDLMRRHVEFGLKILDKSGGVDARVRDMVAHHHERYNGTGYPARLKGNDIPVFGRIAGIVDAYDAMITPRPYAKLQSSYDAIRRLRVLADVEFQAEIVDQFTKAIGAFPTGTLVELNTGQIGIVTKQNRIRRLRPEIMVIIDSDKQLLDDFQLLDLNEEKVSPDGEVSLWIERGLAPGEYGIDPTEFYLN